MRAFCQLRVECKNYNYLEVSKILGVDVSNFENGWCHEFDLKQLTYPDAIKEIIELLQDKYDDLENLRIRRENISIWLLFETENQNNFEFDPALLSMIGNEGLTLCISTW